MAVDKYQLSTKDKVIISRGQLLNDVHIERFHYMLRISSEKILPVIVPRSTLLVQKIIRFPENIWIQPIPKNTVHIQILHSCDDFCVKCTNGHWLCSYYDTRFVYIFDSLNQNKLHVAIEKYLVQLFPYFVKGGNFDINKLVFKKVQFQQNQYDCGVLSIAYATSLFFKTDPSNVIYDYKQLRTHLYDLLQSTELTHFPVLHINQANLADLNNDSSFLNNGKFTDLKINKTWTVHGLPNYDMVSCYANTCVQSLFNCLPIRETI